MTVSLVISKPFPVLKQFKDEYARTKGNVLEISDQCQRVNPRLLYIACCLLITVL